jgi:DUF971 family protein
MTRPTLVEAPSDIVLDAGGLKVVWDDVQVRLTTRQLRSQCRCAACKQLAHQGAPVVPSPDLQLTNASPVGSYGLQLHFSDGHDRGIYPWSYLRELTGC